MGNNLQKFGLTNFGDHWMPFWLSTLNSLNFDIDNLGNTRGARRKRKTFYRKFLDFAEKALEYLYGELEKANDSFLLVNLEPGKKDQLGEILAHIGTDIMDGLHVVYYASSRILKDIPIRAEDKILSIRDRSAAMIMKGGREPKLGYRVQVVRTANGFIGSVRVPEGNIPDVVELVPTISDYINQTTVVPDLVSTDDGYSSRSNLDDLKDLGVRYISMNGSKGKKLTDDELWDSPELMNARKNRSSIEGLIGTLKNRYDFGQLRRWGLKAVTSELMEIAICYNFCRMVELGASRCLRKAKSLA